MRIIRVEQNTPEWDALHVGRVTASMLDAVFAKPDTKAYQAALDTLACDLAGVPRFAEEDKPWFEHGREHEPDALMMLSMRLDMDPWRDAFLIHVEHDWLGCSPDWLVGPDEHPTAGGEIKCRKTWDTYWSAIRAKPNKYQRMGRGYYLQVQAAMAIAGFDVWGYGNYYIGGNVAAPRMAYREIERDDAMISEIVERASEFYETAKIAAEDILNG